VLPEDLHPADPRIRRLWWAVTVLLVLNLGACIAKGADGPADPVLPRARDFEGFGQVAIRVMPSPNELRCALLASTESQRVQGLMDVRDLKGYAGMLFRFSSDSQAGFHMRNTPMPLSIAWFNREGGFVGSADMAPCDTKATPQCQVYSAAGPYRYALEVPAGQLPLLGIGPGSKLVLEATACTPDERRA
jgi:uncharacterized membrane protein (UPF0127 family)